LFRTQLMVVAFAATRGTLGAIELMVSEVMPLDDRAALAIRVLGGRQVGQALLMYLAPDSRVAVTGAIVDGIHGASMVALALRSRRWRRAALAEAAVATVLAGLGICVARLPGASHG
jgi:hypothetical protein